MSKKYIYPDYKWDFNQNAKYAMRWWMDNGYTFNVVSMTNASTLFETTKDGITLKFRVPSDRKVKMKGLMSSFEDLQRMSLELKSLGKRD